MRRLAVFLLALAAVAGVITYQALTHEPPPPLARIHTNVPRPPVARYECVEGRIWMTYDPASRAPLEPMDTGRPC